MQDIVVFSVDIETRGQGPKSNGIISIGVCVGSTTNDNVLEKCRFDMKPFPHQIMEQQCYDEFWSKYLDNFEKLQKDAGDPIIMTKKFRDMLDKWDKTNTVYILCDNPSFDFGIINYYLDVAGCPSLNYRINNDGTLSYRSTHDAKSYARAMLHQGFNNPWIDDNELISKIKERNVDLNPDDHDHMPENDAEFIYRLHYYAVKKNHKL